MVYNDVQIGLTMDAKRARSRGFRHRGIAGDITNKLLRDALRDAIPTVSFDTGQMAMGKRGEYEKENISNQCDIFAYIGAPWEEMYEYVVIPASRVSCVLETKFWVAPSDFTEGAKDTNAQIEQLQSQTDAPVYLVAFRHSGDPDDIRSSSTADETFLIASGETYTASEKIVYPGEFERLVEAVKNTFSS